MAVKSRKHNWARGVIFGRGPTLLKEISEGSVVVFIRQRTPQEEGKLSIKGTLGKMVKQKYISPTFTNLPKTLLFPELYSNYMKPAFKLMLWKPSKMCMLQISTASIIIRGENTRLLRGIRYILEYGLIS